MNISLKMMKIANFEIGFSLKIELHISAEETTKEINRKTKISP